MDSRKVTVNVSNRTIVRILLWLIFTFLLFKFIGRVSHELILIFVSFFLAMALNPMVRSLSRRLKITSRVGATAIAYLVVVAFIVAFLALVTPPLVRQTRTFIGNVPQIVQHFQDQDTHYARLAHKYHIDQKLIKGAKDFANNYANYGSTILDTGKRIVSAVVSVLVVFFMTFIMLVEGPAWVDRFFKLLPPARREHDSQIAYAMYRGVTGFVNGQLILALLAGFFAFCALEIVGHLTNSAINSLALAGIVAVFAIIPLIGNPVSSIIVFLVCLSVSAPLAFIMLAYFIVYFFMESHTIQPVIQSRLNKLTPLTVLIAAILGIGFAGFLGAIIAIPVASAFKVLLEDQIDKRGLRKAA